MMDSYWIQIDLRTCDRIDIAAVRKRAFFLNNFHEDAEIGLTVYKVFVIQTRLEQMSIFAYMRTMTYSAGTYPGKEQLKT